MSKLLNQRYELVRKLGQGGFGETFLAEDTQNPNSYCVIKKLNPHKADLKAAEILFAREAETLKSLSTSDNIPKFFDYFEEEGDKYLVEEHINGTSLNNLLDRPWAEDDIWEFLKEILSILQTLHKQNIIHRDIKPNNLIKRYGGSKNGKYVLIDFGSAKKIDISSTNSLNQSPQTLIMTYGYSPPEQRRGDPALNSDIYALGITAIQLLTGHSLDFFMRLDNNRLIWDKHINVSPKLRNILNKMTLYDREQRYQTAQEILRDLDSKFDNVQDGISLEETTLRDLNKEKNKFDRKLIPKIALTLLACLGLIEFTIYPWFRLTYYENMGNNLLDKNQPEQALEAFQKIIDLRANSFAGWQGEANALFMLGNYRRALSFYKKALSLKANDVKNLMNQARVLYKLGEYQQALDIYNNLLQTYPKNADLLAGKGLAYIGLKEYGQAKTSLDKASEIQPNNPNIWLDAALAIESNQGEKAAEEYYQAALKSYEIILAKSEKSNNPIIWSDKGSVYFKLKQTDLALASYEKALELDNNFYEALIGKANSLIITNQTEEAISTLEKAASVRPQEALPWYSKGSILAKNQSNEQALESFNKAIELNNSFLPAWLGKGFVLVELKKYDEALESFNKALEIEPNDGSIWANQGNVLERLGQRKKALNSYQKAVDLGFTEATKDLNRLRI